MLIAILLLSVPLAAQAATDTVSLTLEAAIARALEANPTLTAARADADAAAHVARGATRAFLPSLALELGGTRTTDPVGVFGLKLRQENFQANDLALDPLNRPDPYGGYATAATVTMPLLAPEGLFGHGAARRAASAHAAAARRMQGATTFRVIEAYWSAQLAARQVEALDTALAAARAHVERAQALREQGLVTGLDARLARVRAAEVEARRVGAAAQAANAIQALGTLLALDPQLPLALTDSLSGSFETACAATDEPCAIAERADLAAARHGAEAAAAGVRSAWGKNLPSVALFGSLARHGRSSPWGEGSGDWTVGFMVRWNVFEGLAGLGAVGEARANHAAALARAEAARAQAELETSSARRLLAAAARRVEVATSALAEATDALAQAELRYQQGQSPITELLDVEAALTDTRLSLLAARRDLFVARAAVDFAYGAYDR